METATSLNVFLLCSNMATHVTTYLVLGKDIKNKLSASYKLFYGDNLNFDIGPSLCPFHYISLTSPSQKLANNTIDSTPLYYLGLHKPNTCSH